MSGAVLSEAHAPGFARRAEALHAEGRTDEAVGLLTSGLRRDAVAVAARLMLARIARDVGRGEEEREWLESVLRIDPECPAALRGLASLPGAAGDAHRRRLAVQEPWDAGEAPVTVPTPRPALRVSEKREAPLKVPSPAFSFPVREEEEEPENGENSPPHVATVTLAEIYFQQGLKEQAAQIYRQLLQRQPDDPEVKRRLAEIEASIADPG